MARFNPGQEVVCIDASPRLYRTCNLKLNEIYTIQEVGKSDFGDDYALLVEIKSAYSWNGSYFEDRFAPVVSITELTEILESFPESV